MHRQTEDMSDGDLDIQRDTSEQACQPQQLSPRIGNWAVRAAMAKKVTSLIG